MEETYTKRAREREVGETCVNREVGRRDVYQERHVASERINEWHYSARIHGYGEAHIEMKMRESRLMNGTAERSGFL